MNKTILIITNNSTCHTNYQGAAQVEKYFCENGWEISNDIDNDDYQYVVFYGCGVLTAFLKKCFNTIELLKKKDFPMNNIYIMGCIAKIYFNELSEYVPKENLIEKQKQNLLDEIFLSDIKFDSINEVNLLNLPISPEKETFYIKIVEGCLKKCTYCVIKNAMPKLKSVPKEKILDQFKIAVSNNRRHIFFIAEDALCYGYDNGDNLFEVINEMINYDQNFTLLIDQFHVRWFEQYYNEIVSLCKKGYIKRLYLSIQHVNNDILKSMGRDTDFKRTYKLIEEFKNQFPEIDLFTDFIVGFPGETESQHQEMVDFIKHDTCFTSIQHLAYSDSKYAQSYHFDNKIPKNEVIKRWLKINSVAKEKSLYSGVKNQSDDKQFLDDITQLVLLRQDYQVCKNSYSDL